MKRPLVQPAYFAFTLYAGTNFPLLLSLSPTLCICRTSDTKYIGTKHVEAKKHAAGAAAAAGEMEEGANSLLRPPSGKPARERESNIKRRKERRARALRGKEGGLR